MGVVVWRPRCSHLAMASSRLRRLLVRLNLLPSKRKGRKKSKVDTFLDRGYNEKDIEKFMDLFGRRCISQDFISEMKEAFSLFDKDDSGYICSKELGSLLRTLGYSSVYREMRQMSTNMDDEEQDSSRSSLVYTGSGFMPDLFSGRYNIRMGSGLATV